MTNEEGVKFLRLGRAQARRRLPDATAEEIDDVVSTAIVRASKAPPYDLTRGSFGTWVRLFVERAIADESVPKHRTVQTQLEEHAETAYYARWLSLNRRLSQGEAYTDAALTWREREVLQAFTTMETNVEVAEKFCVAPRTIDSWLCSAYKKLGVSRLHRALLVAAERYEIVL